MGSFRQLAAIFLVAMPTTAQQATPQLAQQPRAVLDDAQFDRLQRELTPDPAAPWRSVPWQIDLLAAQREAAALHKPLFVWAMDGHPLGCT